MTVRISIPYNLFLAAHLKERLYRFLVLGPSVSGLGSRVSAHRVSR